MGATYTCSFGADGGYPLIREAWLWEDTDDAGLVAALAARSAAGHLDRQDFEVDRSGVQPVLKWQTYTYQYPTGYVATGTWVSLPLTSGDYIRTRIYDEPHILDMTGFWVSDQYGRPYDLNDLLA